MALQGPHIVDGRYAIHDEIASGGMATVHFGCALGSGRQTIVAVKRLHAHLQREHEFVTMFLDEARVAGRIRHPNVAQTYDVVATEREIFLVMEYVHGESLARLIRTLRQQNTVFPLPVTGAVITGLLAGLHAAHEATDERGESLRIVHRDVSPHNVMVGCDGVVRIVDFGVAKAVGRMQQTQTGEIKGKFGYMAPEQVNGSPVTRAADVYAAGVVLWETLTGQPLFKAESDVQLAAQVLLGQISAPSLHVPGIPIAVDDIVMRALDRDPARRFSTAREMARALEAAIPIARSKEVAPWVESLVGPGLRKREERMATIEREWAMRTGQASQAAHDLHDASTRAVTSPSQGERLERTRFDGWKHSSVDTSGLSDTQDREERAHARSARKLGVWIGVAAGAIGVAAIVATSSSPSSHSAAATGAQTTAVAPPNAIAPAQGTATPARGQPATAKTSGDPITVSVDSLPISAPPSVPVDALPVAAPTSVPIESLPHASEVTPQSSAVPRNGSYSPRHRK
jgi:eukaryotic-like serine/threonine-protein kinase